MTQPRVLMVSARGIAREAWLCAQFEAEEVIRSFEQVDVVCPEPRRRGRGALARACQAAARRIGGLDVKFLPRPEPVRLERRYDLFFFNVNNINDLHLLQAVPGWRERCRHAVCRIEEVWAKDLADARRFEPLKQFDRIILPKHGTVEPMARLTGRPCHWSPAAIDALAFCPWPDPPPRKIDFHLMGRVPQALHQVIWEHARRRGWTYLFDTFRVRDVRDPFEHRRQLAALIKRTRFFLVQRAKAGVPEETGAQQEIAFRYYEGAAGGAVLVGEVVRSETFGMCFGWEDSVLQMPQALDEISGWLDDLSDQTARMARISRENTRQCLLRHDWAYRWREILELVDLPPAARLGERLAQLSQRAESIPAAAFQSA